MNKKYIVKQITKNKKGYKVVLNDDTYLQMSEYVFTDYYFYIGKEFEEDELKNIKENINLSKNYEYVVNLLSTRLYSKKAIYLKLLHVKKVDSVSANKIIGKLIDNHYINDKIYAEELINELNQKGFGYNRIINSLKEDGIEDTDYNLNYNDEFELEKAKKHIDSLLKKFGNTSKRKLFDSLYDAYFRLGFEKDVINLVLSSINQYDLLGEVNNLKKDYLRLTMKFSKEDIAFHKQKIIDKLLRKGYKYSDIKQVMEEE